MLGLGPGPLPNQPFPRLFQLCLWQAKRDPVSGTCVYACAWAHALVRLPARLPPHRCMLPPGLRESVCACVCIHVHVCLYACVCLCLHVAWVYTCVLEQPCCRGAGGRLQGPPFQLVNSSFPDEDRPLCRALQPAVEHQRGPLLVQSEPGSHPHV